MSPIQITCIVGARPNFMKMAAILDELRRRTRFFPRLVHTGQHFSPEMSASFFRDLQMPEPDLNLEVGGGTHTWQTSEIMRRLENTFLENRPHIILVVGDVNSTLAAALVAAKTGIPVGHVEAGLRSFDHTMPEEINRLVTDVLSDYLFVSEPSGVENLRREGIASDKVFFVGNVMIDTLLRFRAQSSQSDVIERLGLCGGKYAVVTLHRPSNVDEPERLRNIITVLVRLSRYLPVVFPVHPRTRQKLMEGSFDESTLAVIPPLGYLDFLRLMNEARLVLTDSGGIQEETTILNVPCLTLRENTERPVTIEQGTNRLVGLDPENILRAALETLNGNPKSASAPELWDGRASARIADILESRVRMKA